jgi:hypothetical protein
MTDFNQPQEQLQQFDVANNKALPSSLNILTILSLIGSGLQLLGGVYNYFTVCKSAEMMSQLDGADELGGMAGKMMEGAADLIQKQCDNKLLVLIATLVTGVLCLVGALQMRARKKQGFLLYTVGELAMPIITLILMGSSSLAGFGAAGLIIPIIFVILYAANRKHLIY